MFGNYIYDKKTSTRAINKEKSLWDETKTNDAGQKYLSYLSSLVAHEKTHRFLEY